MVVVAHGLNQGLCVCGVWGARMVVVARGLNQRLCVCGVWCVGYTYGGSSPWLKSGVMCVVCEMHVWW